MGIFRKAKKPVSLRRRILIPMWALLVTVLLTTFIISQVVIERYIYNSIEAEMEGVSTAARDVIEREYIFNEQQGNFQEDIYRLARQLVRRLSELPRRIITTDYDIRFVVHTEEMTLHFVTAEMADDPEESRLATEITGRMLELLQEESPGPGGKISRLFFIDKSQYFAICMPLNLQRMDDVKNGFLISYVNTSSQNSVVTSMNKLQAVIMLAALLIAVFLSWAIAQRLSVPLRRLCEYAETIGELDFRQQDLNSGIKELDELEEEMDRMADRLAKYSENQKKFLLNISHDLRTPLTSIKGYAESICYEVADEPRQAADTILKESRHLEQMVENLLFMSRMDMAEDRFTFETLEMNQAVREARDRMQGQLADRGCGMELQLPEDPVLVWGDSMHLSRALMNIFSNSLRYVQEKITVTLKTENDRAVLSVADDGPGFSEDDLEHLFDRFYKGKKGNFGVGMSIVQMVVERMNGTVKAANAESGGAVVTLSIPLLTEPRSEEGEKPPALSSSQIRETLV